MCAEGESSSAHKLLIGNTCDTTVSVEDDSYIIKSVGSNVEILADDIYAYDSMLAFLEKKLEYGIWKIDEHSGKSDDYGAREGTYRVLFNNMYGGYIAADNRPFAQRAEMLTELYAEYNADIIGLQEYTHNTRFDNVVVSKMLGEKLKKLGYTEILVNDNNNCVPLFYKTDKFTVVDSGFHRYDDGKNDSSKAVTWAVIEDKENAEKFAVASTHFAWKSEDTAARDMDATQLLEIINAIEAKHECPIFFGGDFNCKPASAEYKKIAAVAVDTYNIAEVKDDIKTHHVYATYNEETGLYEKPILPVGTHVDSIDHIFLEKSGKTVDVRKLDVVTDLYALLSTDHCPLVLDFSVQ